MFEAVIIIFGASGDLAKRSLIPALYSLFVKGKFQNSFIFGVSIDDKPKEEILAGSLEFIKDIDKHKWQEFCKNYFYQKLNFKNLDDYKLLNDYINYNLRSYASTTLSTSGERYNSTAYPELAEGNVRLIQNRLLYCSAGAEFFEDITLNSIATGLITKSNAETPWHRIAYEKPFGYDLQSAEHINKVVSANLEENQIFRVDHFLGDQLLANVSYIRFTNTIFEAVWNHNYIDNVEVLLEESITIFDRGRFYDKVGALIDVIQNHVLQMFALTALERPKTLTPEAITKAKLDVLKNTKFVKGVLGQYEGYLQEKYIAPDSKTDTYALLQFEVDNERWKGVPFYLKSGKALKKKYVSIKINFKKAECPLIEGCVYGSDFLEICLSPEAGFKLNLNAKAPEENSVNPVVMEFSQEAVWPYSPKAYEVILTNLLAGNRFVSVSFEEIKESWKIIEAIMQQNLKLQTYKPGSSGPKLS